MYLLPAHIAYVCTAEAAHFSCGWAIASRVSGLSVNCNIIPSPAMPRNKIYFLYSSGQMTFARAHRRKCNLNYALSNNLLYCSY